jgi:hypothetical protein
MLYFVGEFDREQIPKLRRTKKFIITDYLLIKAFFDLFAVKVTTPNILTEVSNLSGDIPYNFRNEFFCRLRANFALLDEHYITSNIAVDSQTFTKFGLTDSIIAKLAPQQYLVVTDDFPLSNYLNSIRVDAINFNHLRFQ